jgi:signal transduction histidine kinase/uncharacterized protein HemY
MKFCVVLRFLVVLAACLPLKAQTQRLDSMRTLLQTQALDDTTRVNTLNDLAFALVLSSPDQTEKCARQALALAQTIGFKRGLADANRQIGTSFWQRSRFVEAMQSYTTALHICQEIGDKNGLGGVLNNIAITYSREGKYAEAQSYYFQSLKIAEEINDAYGIGVQLNNIGDLYERQNNLASAEGYYQKALPLYEQHNKANLSTVLLNLGSVYRKQGKFRESLEYLQKAVKTAEETDTKADIAGALLSIGLIEQSEKCFQQALTTLFRAQAIAESIPDKSIVSRSAVALSETYRQMGQTSQALVFARSALDTARGYGLKREAKAAAESLAAAYDAGGDSKRAFAAYKIAMEYKDSLFNDESTKRLAGIEFGYQLEKQQVETEALRKDNEVQRLVRNVISGGLAAVLVFAGVLLRLNRTQRQQQKEIARQSREIENTNATLQEKNALLERLDNEKNEFLGIVAHDLKNPLASMLITASSVRKYVHKMSPADVAKQMGNLEAVVQRMTGIITNLLDINVIESGALKMNIAPFSISDVTAELVADYEQRAAAKNIRLHYEAPSETEGGLIAMADNTLTREVLDNLISNAIKYSPSGTNTRVRVQKIGETYTKARIEVQDEGPGLSDEDKAKLFGKFARLSARPTGGEHSTGLGLSIVKKMVEAMNGRVWCESELGKGATFIVELPGH